MSSFGVKISAARRRRGWSQARLASALIEESGRTTLDRHYVSRWERGDRTPGNYWLPYLAQVLRLDLAELEQAKAQVVEEPGQTSTLLVDKLPDYSIDQIEEISEHLSEQWHWLVRTDNLLGPRFALNGVVNQINTIEALLATDLRSLRNRVVRLGSQYAESAAWLYEDSSELSRARYWTSRSLEWAYEADDLKMQSWTLFRRSQLASQVNDAVQAISLAQTARRAEVRLPSPMRAAIRVQEARGHAAYGDERAAQRLLEEAHAWATDDTAGDARGGHGSFCTESYIEINRAASMVSLGQPKRAISVYDQALPGLPAVYQRDRAAALSGMAAAYAAADQPAEAASLATQSLRAAQAAGSARITDEIHRLAISLRSHKKNQSVRSLLEELADRRLARA
ncbi:helix-turn-helix domain-containing protein [Pseudonocardia acaciae]|uniref:helix-turn-helix domain-containing protein n=1 Tax=Pseudonocardia acaciae TaxID=551276 RepID=UPI001470032C